MQVRKAKLPAVEWKIHQSWRIGADSYADRPPVDALRRGVSHRSLVSGTRRQRTPLGEREARIAPEQRGRSYNVVTRTRPKRLGVIVASITVTRSRTASMDKTLAPLRSSVVRFARSAPVSTTSTMPGLHHSGSEVRGVQRGVISRSSTTARSAAPPVRAPMPKRPFCGNANPGVATLFKIVAPLNLTVTPVAVS